MPLLFRSGSTAIRSTRQVPVGKLQRTTPTSTPSETAVNTSKPPLSQAATSSELGRLVGDQALVELAAEAIPGPCVEPGDRRRLICAGECDAGLGSEQPHRTVS